MPACKDCCRGVLPQAHSTRASGVSCCIFEQVMARNSDRGLMHFAGPAASLAMSGSLGVAAGAVLGLVLPAPMKAARLPTSLILRLHSLPGTRLGRHPVAATLCALDTVPLLCSRFGNNCFGE